ncbi:6-phospho-3-hexuloisomerase [Terriglobus roseus]|uniref:6-phospho-3-hexuloisomerase n=1 Tax=Terriglobus roseus TaxID=392734 RepID=A0A1H4T9J3_9BACT|nr:6-phospho-3-hexuloisomerase [Terriglobus roseus]SEC52791.1 6-phospho-3-hexuloisomerase [Terriglobus roseus]
MPHQALPQIEDITTARNLLVHELQTTLDAVDPTQLQTAAKLILTSPRIFLFGAGRSGLSLKMVAMRLMHLGLQAYVAGETTTPSITAGDLLVVASASGTTTSVMNAVEVAKKNNARMLAITTAPASKLGQLADAIILLPAASKSDTGERASQQYAGSLFEQAVLLVMDTLFHALWKSGTQSSEELLKRHANLE